MFLQTSYKQNSNRFLMASWLACLGWKEHVLISQKFPSKGIQNKRLWLRLVPGCFRELSSSIMRMGHFSPLHSLLFLFYIFFAKPLFHSAKTFVLTDPPPPLMFNPYAISARKPVSP